MQPNDSHDQVDLPRWRHRASRWEGVLSFVWDTYLPSLRRRLEVEGPAARENPVSTLIPSEER